MILYKALFDYNSSDALDLNFKVNDIIEFISQSSLEWYYGKNIMTGNMGLFPNNFVDCIEIPIAINRENLYVAINNALTIEKGDIVVEQEIQDDYLICWLLRDEDKNILKVPLLNLKKINFTNENGGFTKCIANCNHDGSTDHLTFVAGDVIWMKRKLNDDFGDGILRGKKGIFPLNKIYIEEVSRENIDRKNIWMTLFDFAGTDAKDLIIKKGEKLKFLDRIDNNWNLMQNESGKVGMVPCTYVKNISINAPLHQKSSLSENQVDETTNVNESNLRSINISNEIKDVQLEPNINEYDNQSYCGTMNRSSLTINLNSFDPLNSDNIDENVCDEDHNNLDLSHSMGIADENEVPLSVLNQFSKREKRVENDIEVILNDIKSIQNKCSREDQQMNCNLAFLKEEHKSKLKELEFVKEQKQKILAGEILELSESDYDSIKLNGIVTKEIQKRSKVIEEILDTEKRFISDLKTTLEAFDKSSMQSKIPEQDFNLLFGDLESVISVAEDFLSKLSVQTESEFNDIPVGSIFLQSVNSFEEVYKEYCVNYDRKLDLISKKLKIPNFTEFLAEGLSRLSNFGIMTSALDMMLVKPLQRFLKYPLFLKTIIENTQEYHPDLSDLQAAQSAFEILAQKINEKKRFEELRAITFDRTEKWHMKTLHAIQKKPKRVIVSMSGAVQEVDNDYQLAVTKFKNLKKCISFFIETVFILRDNLKEILNLYSAISDDLASILKSQFHSNLNVYLVTCKRGESDYFKKYICVLDSLVVNPLYKLLELFSGPILLIKKRQSKHIDYLAMKQRCEDKVPRIQIDKMEQLKNQYSAINNTLKEELPILTSKATVILNECLANYLQLTTSSLQSSILSLRNLIGDDQLSIEEELRNCKNQQSEILGHLQRVMTSSNPQNRNSIFKGDSPLICTNGSNSSSRNCIYHQTKEDVLKLKEKFDIENLAYVRKDFVPTKAHQIHIYAGTLVGILKRCNPLGLSSSWLVEVCPKRTGFVPRSYLSLSPIISRVASVAQRPKSGIASNITTRNSIADYTHDLMQFSPNIDNKTAHQSSLIETSPVQTRITRSFSTTNQIRIALFNHQSRGESEITMQKNDKLEILENFDKCGRGEWSLVKNLRTGAQGYVPTNYLSK